MDELSIKPVVATIALNSVFSQEKFSPSRILDIAVYLGVRIDRESNFYRGILLLTGVDNDLIPSQLRYHIREVLGLGGKG